MAFSVESKGNGFFFFKRVYEGFVGVGGPSGPIAYGGHTDNNFPEELAKFKKEHPELVIACITPDKEEGIIKGYLVVCNEA